MNIINGLTNQPTQILSLTLEDGSSVTMTLYFRPQQNGWFYDLQWPGSGSAPIPFETQNRRLVTGANLLRQFINLIPFGLAVFTVDNTDPATQVALIDGSTDVVLLNAQDVASAEMNVYAAP